MALSRFRVGNIQDVSGEVIIAGRDVYKGYTVEQVSVLLEKIQSTFQPRPFDGSCPYKGLDAFEEEDSNLFFGREELVANLVRRVTESNAIFITGPSGSGKSSLLRAGLIPALRGGAFKALHSERWCYGLMEPGPEPLKELARVTSGLAGTLNAGEDIRSKGLSDPSVFLQWCEIVLGAGRAKRVLLLVDQFEEVFTQVGSEEERQAFLRLLTHAVTAANGRVICLFAMRSDFVPNCAAYPELNMLLNRQSAFAQIGAMLPHELVSAIAQPALRVGLKIDPALIAQIINDTEGEPGTLPLMQFALKDLFDSQQEKQGVIDLDVEDYLKRGGIHKALERHADAEFNKLPKSEKALTDALFKGLVEVGNNGPVTRRIARLNEFSIPQADQPAFESLVGRLADARLVSTDEDKAAGRTITLAHEKLIEAWPWLKQLVNDNRIFIQLQNQIIEDALEWENHGKDRSYLYSGSRLSSVQKNIRDYQIKNDTASAFLSACEEAYRQVRTQRLLIVGLLLVMGVVIYTAAIRPWFEDELSLQPIDLGGAGVNALQQMDDGTIYAGMFNYPLKAGGPCLARLSAGTNDWELFGPTCTTTVSTLWINPVHREHLYFSHSGEAGMYRSQDGGQSWDQVGIENGLPLENISSLAGSEDGSLFAADYDSTLGVYKSSDQGESWTPVSGSPAEEIFTLVWHSPEGLLVGGNSGLWLWKPTGEWRHLIELDVTKKDQRIFSAIVIPAEELTILAGGEEGIYLWKASDADSNVVRNDSVKMAYSLVLINKPEPYVIAFTFVNGKVWRMTTEGTDPHLMKEAGANGLPMIAQEEDTLQVWIGTVEGLYKGELRTRLLEAYRNR